ncbi:MAG: hypothetical protein ACHQUC_09275 [Chlamydiales bacterium]
MQKKIFRVLLICLFSCSILSAEVEEIVMKWNALLCLDVCIPTLQQQLGYITNVTDVQINPRAGAAVMRWKPNYPFSYEPFNLASRMVGTRIIDFRMKVRGTINRQQDNYYLVSTGDNSSFLLLGPLRAEPNRYIIWSNIASHPLSPKLRQQLLIAANDGQIVEIEGPLFQPWRYLLMLIVEQIKFPEEDQINPQYGL